MTTRKITPAPLTRSVRAIAAEIRTLWIKKDGTPNVHYTAKPYLDAMDVLITLDGNFYNDPATSVVRYFLSNAASFRGEDARRIKDELEAALAWKSGAR